MTLAQDFFSYDPEDGVSFHATAREAKDAADLIRKAEPMRAMLRRLEWSERADLPDGGWCPICGEHHDKGHAPDCALAALLASPDGIAASGNGTGRKRSAMPCGRLWPGTTPSKPRAISLPISNGSPDTSSRRLMECSHDHHRHHNP